MSKLKRLIKALLCLALVLTVFFVMSWFNTAITEAGQEEMAKIEGAKKEGTLVFYTTISNTAAGKLLSGFSKKCPFVKTELYRTGSERLLTKILAESRAKKYFTDVYLSDVMDSHIIKSKALVLGRSSICR